MNAKGTARRILLLSDTHSHMDADILRHAAAADEVWHAGDIGDIAVLDALAAVKPLRAVHGNIDDASMRREAPADLHFELDGLRVWMTHIGGVAGRLPSPIKKKLAELRPHVFICGHSHILRAGHDPSGVLCLNPGAAGHHGFHHMRTMLRFTVEQGKVHQLEVIELGKRGRLENLEDA